MILKQRHHTFHQRKTFLVVPTSQTISHIRKGTLAFQRQSFDTKYNLHIDGSRSYQKVVITEPYHHFTASESGEFMLTSYVVLPMHCMFNASVLLSRCYVMDVPSPCGASASIFNIGIVNSTFIAPIAWELLMR